MPLLPGWFHSRTRQILPPPVGRRKNDRIRSNGPHRGMTIGVAPPKSPGGSGRFMLGSSLGASRRNAEHVGMVVSRCATAAMEETGIIYEL